jgi:hypothetical protein
MRLSHAASNVPAPLSIPRFVLSSTRASLARGSFRFQSFVPPRGWPILAFFPRERAKACALALPDREALRPFSPRICPLLVFVTVLAG